MKSHAVDWKEHPLEVMRCLDRLATSAWSRDPGRWDFTDALDLDRLRVEPFLAACAAAFDRVGLAIVEIPTDGDDVRFTVVPIARLSPDLARVAAVTPRPTKRALAAAKATQLALDALGKRLVDATTRDGAMLRTLHVESPLRLAMANGPAREAERLRGLFVDTAIGFLDGVEFRTHGPEIEREVLGAALLLGRAGEYVRALAHAYSLGERSKTALWRVFLGRDLPATWKRGETRELDALLLATRRTLPKAIETYLSRVWSSSSRGMPGSRVSLLATGLYARAELTPELPEALARYVTTPSAAVERRPNAVIAIAAPPALGDAGAARDASYPRAQYVAQARAFADWIGDSIAHARRERSGMYLRAVPETAVDVATLAYAAGMPLATVRAWLAWAVDADSARCAGRFAEDTLACGPRTHVVAGAAVLVGRRKQLAKAWQARTGDAAFEATRDWLSGRRTKRAGPTLGARAAILDVLAGGALDAYARAGRLPHPSRPAWPGPFDAFITALAVDRDARTPQVMDELAGRAAPARPAFAWPSPRSKLPDLANIAETLRQQIETGGEPIARAESCLVIARCVHGLGAPLTEVGAWLRRAVDLAKRGKHLREDLVGAARLVGRHAELARTIAPYDGAVEAELAKHVRAYCAGSAPPEPTTLLRKRFFFANFARAMIAARAQDLPAFRKALARAPWHSRSEWTVDPRRRPPDLSWFTMGLAVDMGGIAALPPTALPWVDREIVDAAIAGRL